MSQSNWSYNLADRMLDEETVEQAVYSPSGSTKTVIGETFGRYRIETSHNDEGFDLLLPRESSSA